MKFYNLTKLNVKAGDTVYAYRDIYSAQECVVEIDLHYNIYTEVLRKYWNSPRFYEKHGIDWQWTNHYDVLLYRIITNNVTRIYTHEIL
jgi:hypothetical protein